MSNLKGALRFGVGAFIVAFVLELAVGSWRHEIRAQQTNPGVQQSGAVVAGDCTKWGPGVGQIQDAGSCGGLAPVQSVFGRVGVVIAAIGDYSFAQISGSLAATQLPAFAGGDVTSTAGSAVLTLNTVNANTGAFGGVNSVPSFTVDGKGRITAAAANVPAIPFTELTGSLACGQLPAFTGDTTSPAGSCVNTTVKVNGVAFSTSPATDTIPVITAANTATYTSMPNCTTGVLQYSTSTHLFSCGAAGTGTLTGVNGAGLAVSTGGSPTPTITVPAAAKADEQAGTSAVLATTPSQQQQHDSAIKAWCIASGTATGTNACTASYNVTSVTRTAAGSYTLNFTTAFATTGYDCAGSALASTLNAWIGEGASKTVSAWPALTLSTNAATVDVTEFFVMCVGRQ